MSRHVQTAVDADDVLLHAAPQPSPRTALTALSSLSCALVGFFFLITTVSQSWPLRFISAAAAAAAWCGCAVVVGWRRAGGAKGRVLGVWLGVCGAQGVVVS